MNRNFFPLMDAAPAAGGGGPAGGAAGGLPVPPGGAPGGGQPPAGGAGGGGDPWFKGFVKDDGSLNRDNFARLPENLRSLGDGELKNITTMDQLLAKVHGLSGIAGKKGLAPLPAGASAEDVAAQQAVLRAVNGVPEKPEGYGFKRPDDLPEAAWNEEGAKGAATLMHKLGISPSAANALMAFHAEQIKSNIAAQGKYVEEFYKGQDNEFRTALDKTGDDYDKTMAVVNTTAQKFGIPADADILKNAQVRLMLHGVAKAIGEPALKTGTGGDLQTKSDRALAESIMHDKTNPDYAAYWDGQHTKNKEVKARVAGLLEAAAKAELAAQGGGARR